MESQRKASVLRRKEIVSAARKLIVEYGCDRLTVRRLAEEVGLTGGTLYKHFKSKKDVLSLLIDDIESTLCADLGDSMAHGDDPLQALEQTIDRVRERKGVSFHVLAEIITLGDAELNNKINRAVDSYIASIKRVLSEGIN